ncbi:hypothetical protein LTR17_015808 [Elasticomyces elasticus]|nr:hypothetical protein LTR17_015808 [Elasticomyces elasticus]
MVALELVALALSVLGPFMAQKHSARIAAEDSIAPSHQTFNDAPVLTATLPPAVAAISVQIAVASRPEIETVSLLDTSTNCVFEELCDTTTTNILSWRTRFSYGLLASAGFVTSPDAAHTALQRMFHHNAAQLSHAPKLAVHTSPEKASDEAFIEPSPMKGSWSSATYSHEEIATIVVVGSRGTKTYVNGHILEPTLTTLVITDVSVTQHTNVDDYHVAQSQGFERGQTDSKAEFWPGDNDLLQADVLVTPIDSETRSWLRGTSLWIIAMVFLGFLMTVYRWKNSPDDTSNDTHLPAWDTISIPPMLGTTVDFRPITAPPPDRYGSCEISAAGSTKREQVDQYQHYAPAPINYRSGGRLTLEQAQGLARLQAWNKEGSRGRKERFETDAWIRQAQTAYGDAEMPTQQGTLSQPKGILKNCRTSRPQLQSDMAVAESRHGSLAREWTMPIPVADPVSLGAG